MEQVVYTQDDIDDLQADIARLREDLELAGEKYHEAESKRIELDAELYELRQQPTGWSAEVLSNSTVLYSTTISLEVDASPGDVLLTLRPGTKVIVSLEV